MTDLILWLIGTGFTLAVYQKWRAQPGEIADGNLILLCLFLWPACLSVFAFGELFDVNWKRFRRSPQNTADESKG